MVKYKVLCPYCHKSAELVDSKEIYKKSYGMLWICRPCEAYVGTHKNSKRFAPLGTLANRELREWRKRAHLVFDPIWKESKKQNMRTRTYAWLATKLRLPVNKCHIGMFNLDQCQRTVAVCLERCT